MTQALDYVDAVARQQRAAGHSTSMTLGVHAVALAVATGTRLHPWWESGWWAGTDMLVVVGAYVVLWLLAHMRRLVTGMGTGGEGFGIIAIVSAAVVFFGSFILWMVGAPTLLGLGLVALGARQRDVWLWASGCVVIVVGGFVGFYTIDNHVSFLGPAPGAVVLAAMSIGLVAIAATRFRHERVVARQVPPL